jgi:hypothetical protein
MENGQITTRWIGLASFFAVFATAGGSWAAEPESSISRSHRAISVAAYAVQNDSHSAESALLDLRRSVVFNTAARIALKKVQVKTAMFLTLEARRLAKTVIAACHGNVNDSQDAEDSERVAAAGGDGKHAAEAIEEAEKKIPGLPGFKQQVPYNVDPDDE